MHKIISIVGKSGSGKTTLLERLIVELKERGHRVAIVKHSHHDNDLDTTKKDTWRFTRAGSALSAINSLDHLAIYRRMDHYFDPRELSDYVPWDYDFILTEGFKGSNYPKIEVHNPAHGKELITDPSLLLAVVTDEPLDIDIPQFPRDDVTAIADLIEKTIQDTNGKDEIELVVNGAPVVLSLSQQDVLTRTMLAMIPDSHGPDGVNNLHLSLRRKH
ncbi:MAG: molybdopterin-guanine dinucleotide biosynthesis protein B [Dehalococcoidales bacterium]|nr:molybdopterin-guanine dinucleotide biosynthesis protein B [Dehalococcoidales bacterium]